MHLFSMPRHSGDMWVESLHLFTTQRKLWDEPPPEKSRGALTTYCYLSQLGTNSSSQVFNRPSVTTLQLPCFNPHSNMRIVPKRLWSPQWTNFSSIKSVYFPESEAQTVTSPPLQEQPACSASQLWTRWSRTLPSLWGKWRGSRHSSGSIEQHITGHYRLIYFIF